MSRDNGSLMGRIFNLDNGFMRFLARISDIVLLNFLFVFCSIPIVTFGASLTAMYSVTLKMARNEEGNIIKDFFKAYKENLLQGCILGVSAIIVVAFIIIDLKIISVSGNESLKYIQILCYSIAIWAYIMYLYAFPILARFSLKLKDIFKNSMLISMINIKYTLILVALNIPYILMMLYSEVAFLLLLTILLIFGFSTLALCQSYFFRKVLEKYEEVDN